MSADTSDPAAGIGRAASCLHWLANVNNLMEVHASCRFADRCRHTSQYERSFVLSGQSKCKKEYRTVLLDRSVVEESSSGAGLGEVESPCRRNTRIDARHVNSCSEWKASETHQTVIIV